MLQIPAIPTDERECAALMFQLRWPSGWTCAGCGSSTCTQLRTRPRVFECNHCRKQQSVTAGTPLHRCRLPLTKVLHACVFLTSVGGTSARRLSRLLDVSTETGWTLGHRLRAGFLYAETPLPGTHLRFGYLGLQHRAPRGKPMRSTRLLATILWDETGAWAVQAGTREAHSLRRFVDRHASAERPERDLRPPLASAHFTADRVHRGVSARWFAHYLAAVSGWARLRARGESPIPGVLATTLASPTRGFVRPRSPPLHLGCADWGG